MGRQGHFLTAAAAAMRRILIDRAREKRSPKRGGGRKKLDIDLVDAATQATPDQPLAIDHALAKLTREDPAARLVRPRYFAGLTVDEAGKALGMSTATTHRHWKYARLASRRAPGRRGVMSPRKSFCISFRRP
jgi:RNA polymerase sigma factor (TIGR02999 family)